MFSQIRSIDFDVITLETGANYRVASTDGIFLWKAGDIVELIGTEEEYSIENSTQFRTAATKVLARLERSPVREEVRHGLLASLRTAVFF